MEAENGYLSGTCFSPGQECALHRDRYLLVLALNGSLELCTPDGVKKPAFLLLLSPGQEICLSGPGKVLLLEFDRRFIVHRCLPALSTSPLLREFFFHGRENSGHLARLECTGGEKRIAELGRAAMECLKEKETEGRVVAGSLLGEMLFEIGRSCFIHTAIFHPLEETPLQKILLELLEARGLCRQKETAEKLHYHENTIRRILQRELNMGYAQLCTCIKIAWACVCLHRSDMTVREALSQCGYDNPTQFYRQFEKTVGISPAQYRNCFME